MEPGNKFERQWFPNVVIPCCILSNNGNSVNYGVDLTNDRFSPGLWFYPLLHVFSTFSRSEILALWFMPNSQKANRFILFHWYENLCLYCVIYEISVIFMTCHALYFSGPHYFFQTFKNDFLILNGTEHLQTWFMYHFAIELKLIQRGKIKFDFWSWKNISKLRILMWKAF